MLTLSDLMIGKTSGQTIVDDAIIPSEIERFRERSPVTMLRNRVSMQVPQQDLAQRAPSAMELHSTIFHEPWWLDIATDGQWGEASVAENGAMLGRLPYPLASKFGMRVSTLPSLIRTLGPVIAPLPGKASTAFRRRIEITNALIDQLPPFAYFDHSFEPGITDAIAFAHRGYVVGSTYCFRIAAGARAKDVWAEMTDRRRRVIRRASEDFGAEPFDDIEEFSRFYEANLGTVDNKHGAARLRSLLRAIMARNAGTMLGARDPEGNLVAAVTLVWDAQAMYYLLGTRRPDIAENGATSMLIWKGVQDACELRLTFDFDGATSAAMLQFLAGFGGALTQRLRVRRVNRAFRLINMVQSMVRRRPETPAPANG